MALEDIFARGILLKYLLPVVIVIVVIAFSRKKLHQLRMRLIAWIGNRFLKKMHKKIRNEKASVFSELKSQASKAKRPLQLLEIGSGSGMNFKNFPKGSEIICLDPNPYNKTYLQENLHLRNPDVSIKKFVVGFAESMPEVEDSSCDAVVCTLVLCTVRDVKAVLGEVLRILKPNGIFYFVEHVAARKGLFKRKLQNLINPLWKKMADGCNVNRETWNDIRQAGFSKVDLTDFDVNMFKTHTPGIYGKAVK
ncbi:putative methyltransferase-like protein 7A [Haliotis rufescens]|uniref:putative methyltransferase-like protein 7A n=1 Tax=Haliotis rufescens TaxID=6454 RepID=UPI001EB01E8D|nr:putative methyltransferase-like protein 7A [Haliotis rufescens]